MARVGNDKWTICAIRVASATIIYTKQKKQRGETLEGFGNCAASLAQISATE